MKVSDLGEFGVISRLAAVSGRTKPPEHLIIGIGDDTAAWRCGSPGCGAVHLGTTDTVVEDSHFSFATFSWEDVGWKSVAVNLSDIAAMGGVPEYALVSLALTGDAAAEDIDRLYAGMTDVASRFGTAIVGGDTVAAPQVVLTVTVLGRAYGEGSLLTRAGARPGDVVAVTGSLGASAAGVEVLAGSAPGLPAEAASVVRQACLRPWPRVTEARALVEHSVRAAIDVSDGLVSDLNHVCRASGVGARVHVDRVPVAETVREHFGERALELALAGGEDFELLFTGPAAAVEKISAALACPVTAIGEIVARLPHQVELVDEHGRPFRLAGTGWDHFAESRKQT